MRFVAIVLAAMLCTSGVAIADTSRVERVLEVAAVNGRRVELVVGPESAGMFWLGVRLRGGARSDALLLPWPASSDRFSTERVSGSWGAVDLLAPDGVDTAWASGDESAYVSTSMRAVTLPGGRQGVVVDQLSGFDHLVRAHLLAVVVKGQLREVQRWVGVGAPEVTAVAVTATDVVFERGFLSGEPNEPDEVEFTSFRFDDATGKLVEKREKSRVFTVVWGSFSSVASARAAYSSARLAGSRPCLSDMWVIGQQSSAIIGARTVRRKWAYAAAARIRACSARLHPVVRD